MREPLSAKGQAIVQAATLNVRDRPHMDGALVGKLARDTTVDVWAVDGEWWYVDADGIGGWCAGRYLRPVKPLVAQE